MRTATIDLFGTKYTLCFSARCMANMEAQGGTYTDFVQGLDRVSNRMFALSEMLQAGYIYDKHQELDPPKPPTLDDLLDKTGPDEMPAINAAIMTAFRNGNQRTVEARPTKKENGATQAE